MIHKSAFLFPIFLGAILLSVVHAQLPKTDLSLIKQELQMTEYAQDPEAGAVILNDYGEADINVNSNSINLIYKRYRRVKIFKESALDLSEHEIWVHSGKITNIKGTTYYLDGDKPKSIKLEKKEILTEKMNDGYKSTKFNLPQAKEGSVIEFSYTITYDNFSHIRPWYFQTSYPVAHSEYKTRIPEWFSFVPLFKGNLQLTDKQNIPFNSSVNFSTSTRSSSTFGGPVTTNVRNETVRFKGVESIYVLDHVPAFVEEPYMTTIYDHLSSIEFQLQYVRWPNRPVQTVMSTWEELAKEYMEFESFGERIKQTRLKKVVKGFPLADKSQNEKVAWIYDFVRSSTNWDGTYSDLAKTPLHTVFQQKSGNSGEINLLLLVLLREAGIPAYPVILSTRNNGKIQRIYPLASQFNHVVVLAGLSEGEILLDAISDFTSLGMLPKADLNGAGFLVDEKQADWINIQPMFQQDMNKMLQLKLDPSGTISGSVKHICKGYEAANARKRVVDLEKDEEEYVQKYMLKGWTDVELGETSLKALEDRNAPLEVNAEFDGSDYINIVGEFIYIQPMLNEATEENPFKLEERTYPIDFGYPLRENFMCNLTIPEGYTVDEIPKATRVSLPEGGGSFLYQVQAIGQIVQVMSQISIKQTEFQPDEYGNVKAFFDHIVKKQAEQIVLKKSE
ncbi:MAG: transglutaminase domain-containing protein [Bacteroidota bacterium]